jgi:hypothetical protein
MQSPAVSLPEAIKRFKAVGSSIMKDPRGLFPDLFPSDGTGKDEGEVCASGMTGTGRRYRLKRLQEKPSGPVIIWEE